MKPIFHLGIVAALAMTFVQGQEPSFDELLQQFLNDDGLPRTRETVALLMQDRVELKRAIRSRLNREASGGEMYNLGVLANTIGEDEFKHFVWKEAAKSVVESPVDWWSMGQILANFVEIARPGDESLLKKITETEVQSAPRLPEFAQRKLDSLQKRVETGIPEPDNETNASATKNPENLEAARKPALDTEVGNGSGLSVWGIVIGAIALLVIAVVLLRAAKRKQPPAA